MSEQIRKEKLPRKRPLEEDEVQPKDLKNEQLDQDVEDLLDEIDDVLEENAEEFVKGFRQRGGE